MALAIAGASSTPALAAGESYPLKPTVFKPTRMESVTPQVFEGDVRDLPKAKRWAPGDPTFAAPTLRMREGVEGGAITLAPGQLWGDPLLERQDIAPQGPTFAPSSPVINRDGEPFTGSRPPDTVGDVGPNHFIQMVNDPSGSVFTIYDKSGAVLAGPTPLTSLAPGPPCDDGIGDPIVLYDELADRWLMIQMLPGTVGICYFVSKTPDPVTGGWRIFGVPGPGVSNDYPKIAVWPDAYFLSVNDSISGGPMIAAIDRAALLSGGTFSGSAVLLPPLPGFGFTAPPIPSDLDGATPPPPGAPNYFIRHWDDEVHGAHPSLGPDPDVDDDFLEIWEFESGFSGSPGPTVTGPFLVAVAEFDSDLCGLPGLVPCVPQPGTGQLLDTLREVVMHRLQYRNFGTHETLVGNFTVDVGSDRAGIRWFELRKTPAGAVSWGPIPFQEGTHAPGGHHNWMGSIAMDGAGNIALGYSQSSSTIFPSVHYTGREAGDPLGTMPGGDNILIAGGASQTGVIAPERWGDYSSMSVDPANDCTFWYTNEYIASGSPDWRTRIGTFQFSSCGTGHFLCYKTRKTRGTSKFEKTELSLEDQFENKDFVVKRPRFLCTPADKNDGGIGDPDTHLRSYKIRRVRGESKHVRQKDIQVVNQFGPLLVDTRKPVRLFVPTAKDLDDPVEPLDPVLIDHFKCYKVKVRKRFCEGDPTVRCTTNAECADAGLAGSCRRRGFPRGLRVTVDDQFPDTPKLFKVKRPKWLCVPVDKEGEGILDPDAHLMCYKVKRVRGEPRHEKEIGVHVNNQLGPGQLDTRRARFLCVPSVKILP